jgi:enterochelin esterase-like enzyme
MPLRRRLHPVRAALALSAALWLAIGVWGTTTYVHRYDLYRGFSTPHTPPGIARGTTHVVTFRSASIGATNRYLVYLPPGYAAEARAGRRFPVLYLLHGVPGQMNAFTNIGAINVEANILIARHRIPPMIMIMPAGQQGLHGDTEWANTGAGRWMDFTVDLVHDVDHRFATLRDRQHRAIAGDSEGAYAAINIALHHLGLFSGAQSWSGYFTQYPVGPFAGATPAELRDNSPSRYLSVVAPQVRHLGLRAWLFQGRTDLHNPNAIRTFSAALHAAGADVHYGFFAGGHDWKLWRAQTPRMLVAVGHWFQHRPGGATRLSHLGRSLTPAQITHLEQRRHARCLALKPGPGVHITRRCLAYRARVLGPTARQ